jgi:hypothetical protein
MGWGGVGWVGWVGWVGLGVGGVGGGGGWGGGGGGGGWAGGGGGGGGGYEVGLCGAWSMEAARPARELPWEPEVTAASTALRNSQKPDAG